MTFLGHRSSWVPDIHDKDGKEHGSSIKHIYKPFMVFDVV